MSTNHHLQGAKMDAEPPADEDSTSKMETTTTQQTSTEDSSSANGSSLQTEEFPKDQIETHGASSGAASTEKYMNDEQKPTNDDNRNASSATSPAWDHSDRRVMLQGVHKYIDAKQARKKMFSIIETINKSNSSTGRALEIDKVKKPPKAEWLTITFTKAEMVQPFIDYVNSNSLRSKTGRKLFAKRVEGNNETINKKRKGDDADDNRCGKRQSRSNLKLESRRPVTEDEIKAKVCPLWNLSQEEQHSRKLKDMIRKSSLKIIQEIKSKFRTLEKEQRRKVPFYDWIVKKRSIEVDDVVPVPSPIRNKVELTFGYRYLFDKTSGEPSEDADPPRVPAVGFMVLGWAGGTSRPHCCPNIGSEFCALSDLMDSFLKDSPLPPYDSSDHKGFWRILTIRASRRTRECMVVITHSPSSGGQGEAADWSSHVDKEKERLLEMLKNARLPVPDQDPIRVTSIYLQEFGGLSSPKPDDPVQLVYGKPTLEERLGKCTFHISPGAFFQVNTVGAEILYQCVVDKVREVSDDPANMLLFDVCCGTGTIGITCLKEGVVGRVCGIDISKPAIDNAIKNAEENGYKNDESSKTRFVASRAEHVMSKEISAARRGSGMKYIAVVDPAREGLHANVIRALRANEKISRIVYVSCNPTGSLIKDAGLLCCPPSKKYTGPAFRVSSAKPVDMFPLTAHCEMIVTFDRVTEADKVKPKEENNSAGIATEAPSKISGDSTDKQDDAKLREES